MCGREKRFGQSMRCLHDAKIIKEPLAPVEAQKLVSYLNCFSFQRIAARLKGENILRNRDNYSGLCIAKFLNVILHVSCLREKKENKHM